MSNKCWDTICFEDAVSVLLAGFVFLSKTQINIKFLVKLNKMPIFTNCYNEVYGKGTMSRT
jgi:hypothetical protein